MHAGFEAPYTSAYLTGGTPANGNTILSNIDGAGRPICARCHDLASLITVNGDVHGRSDHRGPVGGLCVNCHVRTPHAWKRPRLIGYVTDPPAYQSLMITGIAQQNYTPLGWNENNCGAVGCDSRHTLSGTLWP